VPLAKWAMLLSGNYRCITKDGMRTAQEAVHSDIETSRSVYNSSTTSASSWVPIRPIWCRSRSMPRRPEPGAAGVGGARPQQRRAQYRAGDKLVQLIAKQKGLSHPVIDAGVALVDARLEANRKKRPPEGGRTAEPLCHRPEIRRKTRVKLALGRAVSLDAFSPKGTTGTPKHE